MTKSTVMDDYIPYGKQQIDQDDIDAVVEVLKSDWITQGPAIEKFERAIARYCGVNYAVAVSSGTAALHIACLAADLGDGDFLWTSPNTFVASANCALYCGAKPDFIDIDPGTLNISIDELERRLVLAEEEGTLPKVVIPVHFAGEPCDLKRIQVLSEKYGFKIIEDASHALGASYKNGKVGSCEFSDMAVFSFHPVKMITTGEGGLITTNNEEMYQQLIRLRSHGVTRDQTLLQNKSEGPWYYEQVELGYNYRITDIQAALGLSQLNKLDSFVDKRQYLADKYDELLKELPVKTPPRNAFGRSSVHLYVIQLQLEKIKKDRREVFEALRSKNIGVNVHYIPVPIQPYYENLGFPQEHIQKSLDYYNGAITLPLFPDLSEEQQTFVFEQLKHSLI